MLNILHEKFDLVIVALIFSALAAAWIATGFNPEMKDLVIYSFGALSGILGVRPRPLPANIIADNIETANTETGDIIGTTPADPAKEKQNEKPSD